MTILPTIITILLVTLLSPTFSQPPPFICPRGTISSNNTCTPCPPGTYQDNFQLFENPNTNATTCTPCSVGTVSPIRGLGTSNLCRQCTGNTISAPNSTVCIPCPPSTAAGAGACLSCPPGSFIPSSPFGDTEKCEPCNPNTYSATANIRETCTRCPPGFFTPSAGSTSLSDCIPCPEGQDSIRTSTCESCFESEYYNPITRTCRRCEPGTVSGASGGCEPCPISQFMELNPLFGPSPDISCQVCPDGFESPAPGAIFCRRIGGPCPSDFITASNGNCVRCLDNYRYDSATNACQPCPPGTGSIGGVETACMNCTDLFLEGVRTPFEIDDLPRTLTNRPFFSCESEPDVLTVVSEQRGRNSIGTLSIAKEGQCPPGTQKFEVDGLPLLCEECLAGSFSTEVNAEKCKECPQDTISQGGNSECTRCTNGTVPDSNFRKCINPQTECPQGELMTPFGTCTKPCPNGKLPPLFEDIDACKDSIFTVPGCNGCERCADGKTREAFSAGKCVCSGSFAKTRGLDDTGKCVECPPGYYGKPQVLKLEAGDNICTPCPAGTFGEKIPEEELLAAGEATRGPGLRSACKLCPVDSFTDKEGMTECTKCPAGSFTYGRGETECIKFSNTEFDEIVGEEVVDGSPEVKENDIIAEMTEEETEEFDVALDASEEFEMA